MFHEDVYHYNKYVHFLHQYNEHQNHFSLINDSLFLLGENNIGVKYIANYKDSIYVSSFYNDSKDWIEAFSITDSNTYNKISLPFKPKRVCL